ncbi:MAG: DUF1772 domain-containing protein [Henriciella sp.]
MLQDWPIYLSLFLALWSAVIGGVFSAFSEFIMSALMRTSSEGGIEAMQQINHTVIKTQFVVGILAIAGASIAFAFYGNAAFEGTAKRAVILAPIVYIPSVFLMTIFGNVPMNNKLESLPHTSREAEAYWPTYGRDWTRLNHARTLGSVATSVIYLFVAVQLITALQA